MRFLKKMTLDVSWVFLSQVLTLGSGFVLSLFIGRWLGPAYFGVYMLAITIYSIASLLAGIGIPTAVVKYIAESRDSPERMHSIATSSTINSVVIASVFATAVFLGAETMAGLFHMPDLSSPIRLLALAIPIFVVNSTLLGLLNGLQEMHLFAFRSIFRSILIVGTTLGFVWLGLGIRGAILAQVVTEFVLFIFMIAAIRARFTMNFSAYRRITGELTVFGLQLLVVNTIWLLTTYADTLLIGYFLTDADVGIYSIAVAIAKTGFIALPGAISLVTYPMIANNHSRGLREENEWLMNLSIKGCLIFLSSMGFLLIVFSDRLIMLLFSPEYLPAAASMNVLVAGMLLFGPVLSIGSAVSAMNRPGIAVKVNAIVLATNILLDIPLIQAFGITGAAVATSLSLLLSTVLFIILQKKLFNIQIQVGYYGRALGLFSLMLAIYVATKGRIGENLLAIPLFFALSVMMCHVMLTPHEKGIIWSVVRGLYQRSRL